MENYSNGKINKSFDLEFKITINKILIILEITYWK